MLLVMMEHFCKQTVQILAVEEGFNNDLQSKEETRGSKQIRHIVIDQPALPYKLEHSYIQYALLLFA